MLTSPLARSFSACAYLLPALWAADCPPPGLDPQQTLAKFQEIDQQAQSAFDNGQYAAAAQRYREAACLAPKSARAHYGLGISEAAAGNFIDARKALETAYAVLPDNVMPLAMLVRVNVAMKDIAKVKEVLRTAAQRFPGDVELHSGLARFLAESKLLDLALAESLRVAQVGGGDAESTLALAVLEQTAGACGDAIHHALAVENQPGISGALKASAAGVAGLSYESAGQRDEAIRLMKLAIELAPTQENSYLALAYLYEKAQKFNEAAGALRDARKHVPSTPGLLLALGNNLVWAEQFPAGVEVLNELVRMASDQTEAYLRLAEAYRKMGQTKLEIQSLQKLGRAKPDYPMIHILIAQAMMRMDPIDSANILEELALAEKRTPNDPDIFFLRGKIYAGTNRAQEAVTAFKRAIDLRPMEPGPYYQLGLLYGKLGQKQLARQMLDRMEHMKR